MEKPVRRQQSYRPPLPARPSLSAARPKPAPADNAYAIPRPIEESAEDTPSSAADAVTAALPDADHVYARITSLADSEKERDSKGYQKPKRPPPPQAAARQPDYDVAAFNLPKPAQKPAAEEAIYDALWPEDDPGQGSDAESEEEADARPTLAVPQLVTPLPPPQLPEPAATQGVALRQRENRARSAAQRASKALSAAHLLSRPADTGNTSRMSILVTPDDDKLDDLAPVVVDPETRASLLNREDSTRTSVMRPIPKPLLAAVTDRHKLKYCGTYTNELLSTSAVEQSGQVYRRSRLHLWKPAWAVLRDSTLWFFETSSSTTAAKVKVSIDGNVKVTRLPAAGGKTYVLSVRSLASAVVFATDSSEEIEAWATALDSAVRMHLRTQDQMPAGRVSGFGLKLHNGFAHRRFLSLVGCAIFYSGKPLAPPRSHINLAGARLQLFDPKDDSDNEDGEPATSVPPTQPLSSTAVLSPTSLQKRPAAEGSSASASSTSSATTPHFALQIQTDRGQFDLLFDTANERNRWAHFCAGVTGQLLLSAGTAFELRVRDVVQTLKSHKKAGNDSGAAAARKRRTNAVSQLPPVEKLHSLFSGPELWPTPEPRTEPLTTLPDKQHDALAAQLHQQLHLFVNVSQSPSGDGLAYHIKLAQTILNCALTHPELFDELFAQLLVQTNRPWSDSGSTYKGTAELMPLPHLERQAWQLLALTCPMYSPSKTLAFFLRAYLQYRIQADAACRRAALYCATCLDRVVEAGNRASTPSYLEVQAVLSRDVGELPHFMSLPIFLSNGNHFLAGLDASCSFAELCSSVCEALGIRAPQQSGFALLLNDPQYADAPALHSAREHVKVCDALSQFAQAQELKVGHVSRTGPTIALRRRLWFRAYAGHESDVEAVLVAYQLMEKLHLDELDLPPDVVAEVAGRMARVEFGDLADDAAPGAALHRVAQLFLPPLPKTNQRSRSDATERAQTDAQMLHVWRQSAGRSSQELARECLALFADSDSYGLTMFRGTMLLDQATTSTPASSWVEIWLGIGEDAVQVFSYPDRASVARIPYRRLRHFGPVNEEFRLLYTDAASGDTASKSVLLHMEQIIEPALLIASYINVIVRREGVHCVCAQVTQLVADVESPPEAR